MPVVIDLLRGEALIGRHRVAIEAAGVHGEIRADGTVLRPLAFGERTQIVARAASTQQPEAGVIAGITRAAAGFPSNDSTFSSPMIEALALALAGADRDGPAFSDAVHDIGRAGGWRLADILDAPAIEVDRLASATPPATDDGWHRVQFSASVGDEASVGGGDADVASIVMEYAASLLRRLDSVDSSPQVDEFLSTASVASAGVAVVPPLGNFELDDRTARSRPLSSPASDSEDHPDALNESGAATNDGPSPPSREDASSGASRVRWRLGSRTVTPAGPPALEVPGAPSSRAAAAPEGESRHRAQLRDVPVRVRRGVEDVATTTPSTASAQRLTTLAPRVGSVAGANVSQHIAPASHPHILNESHEAVRILPGDLLAPMEVTDRRLFSPPSGRAARAERLRNQVDDAESPDVVADRIAWLLDAECDLRGLER